MVFVSRHGQSYTNGAAARRDKLRWSKDPKPLVEYLRSATLSSNDVNMLRQTQYLPAENDESRTFAPSELFLPGKLLSLLRSH